MTLSIFLKIKVEESKNIVLFALELVQNLYFLAISKSF